jgi:hypothetical protein
MNGSLGGVTAYRQQQPAVPHPPHRNLHLTLSCTSKNDGNHGLHAKYWGKNMADEEKAWRIRVKQKPDIDNEA